MNPPWAEATGRCPLALPIYSLTFTHKLGETYAHTGIFPEAQKLPGRFYRTSPLVQKDVGKGKGTREGVDRSSPACGEGWEGVA